MYEALVARVIARLGAGAHREPRDVIATTIDELGFGIDEASGEVVAKPARVEMKAPEDNWRNSVHVPARRRR